MKTYSNWEIKAFLGCTKEQYQELINLIQEINIELNSRFGSILE
jgi:hypothetical protein